MPETLLSPSNILLYGRELADVVVRHENVCPPDPCDKKPIPEREIHGPFVERRGGVSRFLDAQLEDPNSRLARIYGFTFEGYYYDLARPAIFLVHGDGAQAEDIPLPAPREARAPAKTDLSGAGAQGYSFPEDMRVWSYDKGDFSMRLEVETGTFEEILLAAEVVSNSQGTSYSGANVRGANVRGANVRGANVRGANVRGANVRGGGD